MGIYYILTKSVQKFVIREELLDDTSSMIEEYFTFCDESTFQICSYENFINRKERILYEINHKLPSKRILTIMNLINFDLLNDLLISHQN